MRKRNQERGVAILVAALLLLFAIPVVGLAIDVGLLLVVKARLGAAVESAALAAGRTLPPDQDIDAQQAAARAAATRFFDANFPPGYMGTDTNGRLLTATLQPANGGMEISVTGSVRAPTYFMRMFSAQDITLTATGKANRPSHQPSN
jgi:Flp pilus assembly protein TadG